MSHIEIWFSGANDMVVEVSEVADVEGLPIDDAVINVTLVDSLGVDVVGIVWPVVIPFVSSGLYRETIEADAEVINGQGYTLNVVLTTPGGGNAEWAVKVGGKTRS